jgi:hypothetical protein
VETIQAVVIFLIAVSSVIDLTSGSSHSPNRKKLMA